MALPTHVESVNYELPLKITNWYNMKIVSVTNIPGHFIRPYWQYETSIVEVEGEESVNGVAQVFKAVFIAEPRNGYNYGEHIGQVRLMALTQLPERNIRWLCAVDGISEWESRELEGIPHMFYDKNEENLINIRDVCLIEYKVAAINARYEDAPDSLSMLRDEVVEKFNKLSKERGGGRDNEISRQQSSLLDKILAEPMPTVRGSNECNIDTPSMGGSCLSRSHSYNYDYDDGYLPDAAFTEDERAAGIPSLCR